MTSWKPTPSRKRSNSRFAWANCAAHSGHFPSLVLALDPHRLVSYSKREMIKRRPQANQPAVKQLQTFFLLDTQTRQPLCLVNASCWRRSENVAGAPV
jgi:hypothetical protein